MSEPINESGAIATQGGESATEPNNESATTQLPAQEASAAGSAFPATEAATPSEEAMHADAVREIERRRREPNRFDFLEIDGLEPLAALTESSTEKEAVPVLIAHRAALQGASAIDLELGRRKAIDALKRTKVRAAERLVDACGYTSANRTETPPSATPPATENAAPAAEPSNAVPQAPLPALVPSIVPSRRGGAGETQATRLLALLLQRVQLFQTPGGDLYAAFLVNGCRRTCPIRSTVFRLFIVKTAYEAIGRTPSAEIVATTRTLLEAQATFGVSVVDVFTRVAPWHDRIYIDLGDPMWKAIEVRPDGWNVVEMAPVPFRRAKGMLALPTPVPGGSIDELRNFVNVESDRDFLLLKVWLVAALAPRGPYPVLQFHGEHGAAKTSSGLAVRSLIDPNEAPFRGEPRDLRDLAITAKNSHVTAFDNLSGLATWLSDGLCRISTGGGFATRALFTDDEEAIFNFQRPIILTGINQVATRGDLIDRTMRMGLAPILARRRRADARLWAGFEVVRPRILGALLTVLSTVLRERAGIELATLPRMADFAILGTAAESALGVPPGAFMEAYNANLAEGHSLALDASSIGDIVLAFCQTLGPAGWRDTPTALFNQLNARIAGPRQPQDWPKTSQHLSAELRRLAPDLRAAGFDISFPTNHHPRLIEIKSAPTTGIATSPLPPATAPNVPTPGTTGDAGDAVSHSPSAPFPPVPLVPAIPLFRSIPLFPDEPLHDANSPNLAMVAPIVLGELGVANRTTAVIPVNSNAAGNSNPPLHVLFPDDVARTGQRPVPDDDDQLRNIGREPR